jgi:hypothetical protein
MRHMSTRIVLVLALAATALGCLPASTSPTDAGSDSGGAVTYTKDVQPIFGVKCAPCHTGQSMGNHNIGTTYADALKPVVSLDSPAGCWLDGFNKTMPKTIGECTVPAIMEGWMPMAMGCFNTPRPDTCVSVDQQAIVEAWVAAGMPQ